MPPKIKSFVKRKKKHNKLNKNTLVSTNKKIKLKLKKKENNIKHES